MVKTNHSARASTDISKLVRFDERARRFEVLRDVSRLPAGHFVNVSLRHETAPIAGLPGRSVGADVGCGDVSEEQPLLRRHPRGDLGDRRRDAVLRRPRAAGDPTWAADESSAAPLFEQPEIGDLSVTYIPRLDLWLMLYDAWPGRRGDPRPHREAAGVQLRTSATAVGSLERARAGPPVSSTPGRASSSTWPIPTTGSSGRASAPTARPEVRAGRPLRPLRHRALHPGRGRPAEAVLRAVDLEPVRRCADELGVHDPPVSRPASEQSVEA